MKKIAVITPTIGKSTVIKAIESVAMQTMYESIDHVLVIDGPDFSLDRTIISELSRGGNDEQFDNIHSRANLTQIRLPFNTGGDGFYGHRIYASIPHILDHEYIAFLDEDNWYEPDHIESLVDTIESGEKNYDFVHSLRKIYRADGTYACDDNCESLGKWLVWPVLNVPKHEYHPAFGNLVDTSSYFFRTSFLIKTAHFWHSKWGGDRNFFYNMKEQVRATFTTSGKHTLCYRLDGNPGSVTEEFFINGNKKTLEYYNGELPWLCKNM